MWQILHRNPRAFGSALLLHSMLAVLILLGVDWSATSEKVSTKPQVVQATIVDSKAMEAETATRRQAAAAAERKAEEAARRQAEAAAKRKAEEVARRRTEAATKRKAEEVARQRVEAERKAAAEAKRREEAEARRQAAAKRKAKEETRRRAEAATKRKAEEVARQRAGAERKAAAEAKRREEAEARRQAEAKRKAEKEAAAKRKAEEEAEARQAREEDLLAALEAEQAASELSVYTSAIQERVRQTWVRQPGMGQDLSCLVEVKLIPGGEVVPASVHVIRSSGNPAFDRSVVTAVYKASPLPIPSGRLFERFRNLRLDFKP